MVLEQALPVVKTSINGEGWLNGIQTELEGTATPG